MKRLLLLFALLAAIFTATAQSEHSIIIDQSSFRAIHNDALTGVNIDPIGVDSSRRPCARIKVKINRMSREDIDKLEVKIHSNNQLTKCKTAEYDNGLIIEMTAKNETRFYFYHPEFGYSNEVNINLEPNKEYYLEASLNQTFSIIIDSNTAGADVYLDNIFKGTTDSNFRCTIKNVLIGPHSLKLVYSGLTREQKIEVNSDNISFRQDVNIAAPDPQFVVFSVKPKNAVVIIENKHYTLQNGVMRLVLERGTYNYTITAIGYHPYSDTFTVEGEKITKQIELTADSAEVVITAPDNAEIWINDEKKGSGLWRGTLASGTYIFEARKEGHKSSAISKQITSTEAVQEYSLPAPTPIYGSIIIDGTPLMANVTLDDKLVGQTPIKLSNVLVGKHTLSISMEEYETEIQTIVVNNGETITINTSLNEQTYRISRNFKIGDLVSVGGVQGIVFQTNPVKVVSVEEGFCSWGKYGKRTNAEDEFWGEGNIMKIQRQPNWEKDYPAFSWCVKYGDGWFLPSLYEANYIYYSKNKINQVLQNNRKDILGTKHHLFWTSTERSDINARYININNGKVSSDAKSYSGAVRAVKTLSASEGVLKTPLKGVTPIVVDISLTAEHLNAIAWKRDKANEYNAAVQFHYVAAKKGSANSQCCLGYYFSQGLGIEQNNEESVKWYHKAAEQGDATAQYNLGLCYESNRLKDKTEAIKWYRKSAEQGYKNAIKRLKELGY